MRNPAENYELTSKGGKMRRKASVSLLFLICGLMVITLRPASARVDVEPYAAFLLGSSDKTGPQLTQGQKYTGLAYGVKLAASIKQLPFMRAGVTFEGASVKSTPPPQGPKKYSPVFTGVFLGYTSGPFHFDLQYFFESEFDGKDFADSTYTGNLDLDSQSTFGADFGYTVHPFVKLNLSFRRFSGNGSYYETGSSPSTDNWKYRNTLFLLGGSFPVEITSILSPIFSPIFSPSKG